MVANLLKMERETGLEPATSSLGSWHSTAELLPLICPTLIQPHYIINDQTRDKGKFSPAFNSAAFPIIAEYAILCFWWLPALGKGGAVWPPMIKATLASAHIWHPGSHQRHEWNIGFHR